MNAWEKAGWDAGATKMQIDEQHDETRLAELPALALQIGYFLAYCIDNIKAIGCKVVGHNFVIEESGDAESGPSYSWHCTRCGCGGHRNY